MNVIAFPFAGGSCDSYRPLVAPGANWTVFDPPGHGRRMEQALLQTSARQLANA